MSNPVPFEYLSDICSECPIGCEQPFRSTGCPYGFFDEDDLWLLNEAARHVCDTFDLYFGSDIDQSPTD